LYKMNSATFSIPFQNSPQFVASSLSTERTDNELIITIPTASMNVADKIMGMQPLSQKNPSLIVSISSI
jgi:hypothetical protein